MEGDVRISAASEVSNKTFVDLQEEVVKLTTELKFMHDENENMKLAFAKENASVIANWELK